ncbi:MAG TPA: cupin domain-containing protein [Pyrinomonadaceae bacterium]|nr:cupin domain-containing protein [Pyrinomonadaceae bacterium]
MSITLEGGCRVAEMYEGEPLAEGTARIWNQVGRATGAQAISLRILEFAPGRSPAIRNEDCDEILYVLGPECGLERETERGHPVRLSEQSERTAAGKANATILINGRPYDIGPDTGIYIRPNETFALDNPGPDSVVLVSSRCPDPEAEPEFVARATSTSASPAHSPLVRLADRRAQPTADRWYRVLVDDEVGSTQATQFVGSIPPGRAPDHFHHYEEVLFILKGSGRMWAGETNTPIAPGSCIYLPKKQVHCVENTGESELRLLGVFYPAGSPSVRYDA